MLQSVSGASSEAVGREAPQSCSHVSRAWEPRSDVLTALSVILRRRKAEAPGFAFRYAELVGHVRVGDGGAGEDPAGDLSTFTFCQPAARMHVPRTQRYYERIHTHSSPGTPIPPR